VRATADRPPPLARDVCELRRTGRLRSPETCASYGGQAASARLKGSRYNDDDWTWRAQRDEIGVSAQNRSAKAFALRLLREIARLTGRLRSPWH